MLFARVDEERVEFPKNYRSKETAGPGRAALAQALNWLREAKRPAILAGGGVWFAQAAAELTRFAELTNTPVMTNAKARGSISEEHPLCFGGFGAIHPAIHGGSGGADLVILLGTRIGMFTGGRNSVIPGDARVIQVDIEPEEIGRNRNIELGIVSDCGEFLRQACAAAKDAKIRPSRAMARAVGRDPQCNPPSLRRRAQRRARPDSSGADGARYRHDSESRRDRGRRRRRDRLMDVECVDGTSPGTIPERWSSRVPGNRPPVRARMRRRTPTAGSLHRRRRIGGAQFLAVPYRGEEQPADHRRNQQ